MSRTRYLLYAVLLSYLISACSQGTSESGEYTGNVHLEKPGEIKTLKDDKMPIGRLDEVYVLDNNRLLIVEGAPAVRIYEDYTISHTIGNKGPGSCEYESISAVHLDGDTLSVLSPAQSKIINYNINSGECLGEISNETLSRGHYLYRDSISYITAMMSYTVVTPDTTPVFYRLYADGTAKPLDLLLKDINSVRTFISTPSPALDFTHRGNELFTYFPLTDRLVALNLNTNSFRSFPIRVDIRREDFEAAGDDPNKVLNIIFGDFPFVRWVQATDNWIALQYVQREKGGGSNPNFTLQFYSPGGTFIGQVTNKYQIVGFNNGRFIELRTDGLEGDYSFGLAFRGVTID